jgi:hypothetical protein
MALARAHTTRTPAHRQSADGLTIWPCSGGNLPNPGEPGERERASPHG